MARATGADTDTAGRFPSSTRRRPERWPPCWRVAVSSSPAAAAASVREAPVRGRTPAVLRWAIPLGLLAAEGLALSLLVDFPTAGEARQLAAVLRLALPVAIGAGAAGWLIARGRISPALRETAASLPPWRPLPWLALHLGAFGGTAWLALRLMGNGASPPGAPELSAWLLCAAASALLAMASAAPLGWQLRVLAPRWRTPLLALAAGLLAWRAAAAAEGLWGVLTAGTLRSVVWLLQLVAGDVFADAARQAVGVDGFEVVIAPICSGVDGIGLVALFQGLWIALARSRLRFPRALLLLPAGAAAAFAANVVRISVLVLVGGAGGESLALGGFHSKLGWILFIAIALGSVALAERSAWLRREEEPALGSGAGVPAPAAAYLAPLLAALATALVTSAWSAGPLDRGYALRIAAAIAALALVRGGLPRPAPSVSWVPLALGAAVGAAWVGAGAGEARPLAEALAGLGPTERWAWLAARVLGSCLVIPLVEELAFRGFLLPWLASPDFQAAPARAWSWPAVALSSLAFGALHQQWILGTLAGVAFAAARRWRGRLGDAVLAHGIANAAVAAAVLLGGRWGLWG